MRVSLPDGWRERAERHERAVGFEGGGADEVDVDGRFFLVLGQWLSSAFGDDGDEKLFPPEMALEFASTEERESYLVERFGELLMSCRHRQSRRRGFTPLIGRLYPVVIGHGYSTVVDLEYDAEGQWIRVKLRFAFGCIPLPPEGDPKADPSTWEVPMSELWISRLEWQDYLAEVEL